MAVKPHTRPQARRRAPGGASDATKERGVYYLPRGIKAALKKRARLDGMGEGDVVREALIDYLGVKPAKAEEARIRRQVLHILGELGILRGKRRLPAGGR